MAPPRKNANDLSQSTLHRGPRPWSFLWMRKVDDVRAARIPDRAKLTWLYLQPHLLKGDGFLGDLHDIAPYMSYDAYRKTVRGKSALDRLKADIEELIEAGILHRNSEEIFDPRMVEDYTPERLKVIQDLESNAANAKKCPGDIAQTTQTNVPNADNWRQLASNVPNLLGDTAQSRVEVISTAPAVTNYDYNSTNYKNGGPPRPPFFSLSESLLTELLTKGLTETDLTEVQAKFPNFNFAYMCERFRDVNIKKRKFTRGWFEGFFKHEKPNSKNQKKGGQQESNEDREVEAEAEAIAHEAELKACDQQISDAWSEHENKLEQEEKQKWSNVYDVLKDVPYTNSHRKKIESLISCASMQRPLKEEFRSDLLWYSQDQEIADEIIARLDEHGLVEWREPEPIQPRDDLAEALEFKRKRDLAKQVA